MSFTEDIKNEVSQIVDETHEEKLAMLAALVKINGTLGITNKGLEIRIKTENKNTANFIYTMIQEVFRIIPKVSYSINPKFKKNEVFATVESVKAASEIYMPISGTVTEINEEVVNSPELLNDESYQDKWLIKISTNADQLEFADLLDYSDYKEEVL